MINKPNHLKKIIYMEMKKKLLISANKRNNIKTKLIQLSY